MPIPLDGNPARAVEGSYHDQRRPRHRPGVPVPRHPPRPSAKRRSLRCPRRCWAVAPAPADAGTKPREDPGERDDTCQLEPDLAEKNNLSPFPLSLALGAAAGGWTIGALADCAYKCERGKGDYHWTPPIPNPPPKSPLDCEKDCGRLMGKGPSSDPNLLYRSCFLGCKNSNPGASWPVK